MLLIKKIISFSLLAFIGFTVNAQNSESSEAPQKNYKAQQEALKKQQDMETRKSIEKSEQDKKITVFKVDINPTAEEMQSDKLKKPAINKESSAQNKNTEIVKENTTQKQQVIKPEIPKQFKLPAAKKWDATPVITNKTTVANVDLKNPPASTSEQKPGAIEPEVKEVKVQNVIPVSQKEQ